MAADGSVTLDMSLDITAVTKAIDKLNAVLQKFGATGAKDVDQVSDAIDRINDAAKELKIEPTTKGMQQAVEDLDNLNAKIDNQRYQLENYREEYAKVADEYGNGSDKALKLEKAILSLESSMTQTIRKSDKMADAIGTMEDAFAEVASSSKKAEKGVENAADAAQSAEDNFSGAEKAVKDYNDQQNEVPKAAESAKKGISITDTAIGNFISNTLSKAISAVNDLLEKTQEFRQDMSKLNENALSAGVSLDVTSTAMRNLNAITGETDSNVEAVSNLIATGFKDNSLLDAVDALSGAVIKFPDTMKIESLADSLQETVATKEATGQFAELLGRLGVSVDGFNQHLKTLSTTRRADYALQVLQSKGLSELNDSYRENNKTLIDAANAQYDLNEALSEVASVLEPLKAEILTELADLLQDNKETIQGIISAIGGLISGILRLIDGFSNLNPVVQILIVAFGAILVLILRFGTVSSISFGLFAKGVASGVTSLSTAGPAALSAGASFAQLSLEIMGVALTIAVVIAAIAALISAIAALVRGAKGIPDSVNINVDSVDNIPNASDIKNKLKQKGYASGTKSAASGYAWVGENGPELVKFNGGEEVLNANQSLAKRFSGNGRQTIYNENTTNVFKVDDIKTYQRIESRMKRERISKRMGYVGVK